MPANWTITCPRNGANFYACKGEGESNFVGCCKINPCLNGCDEESLSIAAFVPELHGEFPDAGCDSPAKFYTCRSADYSTTFWGCCKSDPCRTQSCPLGDTMPAKIKTGTQESFYAGVSQPLRTPTVIPGINYAKRPPALPQEAEVGMKLDMEIAKVLSALAMTVIFALCAAIALWVGFRGHFGHNKNRLQEAELVPLTDDATKSSDIQLHTMPTQPRTQSSSVQLHDVHRLGLETLLILLTTSAVILGLLGFLTFLWFGDQSNGTWSNIMTYNWATRSVSITALFLRTAVDFQVAIASAILASLLLESSVGVHLYHVARVSPMRSSTTNPWVFAHLMVEELWRSVKRHKQTYKWTLFAVCLVITTSLLQFSSTILLSDLTLGPLSGSPFLSEVRPGLSYYDITKRILRDTAWVTNPPFYPSFGEYHEPPQNPPDGVADTGKLLRAFLPYDLVESRQRLRSYTGRAMVLDARVSCQAPNIMNFTGTKHYSELRGEVLNTRNATMLKSATNTTFDCVMAGVNEYTLCQLGRPYPLHIGSLASEFVNSTSFGTAYLVIKGINSSNLLATNYTTPVGEKSEWANIAFANGTGASFSLCYAPWDASILEVNLSSTSNRTEPRLQWWQSYKTNYVINHFIPQGSNLRQILSMKKPNLVGDLPPKNERPLVQSDPSGSSAARYGSDTALPPDWSIFLTGEPLITIFNQFTIRPRQSIAADPALGAIFTDALANGHSVAWALSTVITILSATNYYNQQPAFDRIDNVTVSFYTNVLYPRDHMGLVLLLWTLVAHFTLLAVLIVLFTTSTKLTLLGNAWAAFSQMADSQELRKYMSGVGLKSDIRILEELNKEDGDQELRARVVSRGGKVEITVE